MERFIHRENLALLRKRLAESQDDAQRRVLLKLLSEEEAKRGSPKAGRVIACQPVGMPNSTFRCPNTGMNAPRPFALDPDADPHAYGSTECPACGGLHLFSRSNRQFPGDDKN